MAEVPYTNLDDHMTQPQQGYKYDQGDVPQQNMGQLAHNQQYAPDPPPVSQPYGQGQPPPYMMQPMSQQSNTTVVINQPGAAPHDTRIIGTRDGHREWSSGLFSCCADVGKCVYACFCPCCVLADISNKLGECCCTTCCVPGALIAIRARTRTLGDIKGSICNDCIATVCCEMCVMCQIHRELEYMGL